jgi:hypothetical protein
MGDVTTGLKVQESVESINKSPLEAIVNLGDRHVIVSFDIQSELTDSERVMGVISILKS